MKKLIFIFAVLISTNAFAVGDALHIITECTPGDSHDNPIIRFTANAETREGRIEFMDEGETTFYSVSAIADSFETFVTFKSSEFSIEVPKMKSMDDYVQPADLDIVYKSDSFKKWLKSVVDTAWDGRDSIHYKCL